MYEKGYLDICNPIHYIIFKNERQRQDIRRIIILSKFSQEPPPPKKIKFHITILFYMLKIYSRRSKFLLPVSMASTNL